MDTQFVLVESIIGGIRYHDAFATWKMAIDFVCNFENITLDEFYDLSNDAEEEDYDLCVNGNCWYIVPLTIQSANPYESK